MTETTETVKKFHHLADFGESLSFNFVLEKEYCYPSIRMDGGEGTSAELFGQSMTPEEIEHLGLALLHFAAKLRS